MKPRTIIILVASVIATTLVVLNWAAFIAPATLSLGFRTIEAPLGLVMLGLTLVVGALLIGYSVFLRKVALIQAGRYAEELQAQRKLADDAEASRFTDLRRFIDDEFRTQSEGEASFRADVRSRLEALEREVHDVNHPKPAHTLDDIGPPPKAA